MSISNQKRESLLTYLASVKPEEFADFSIDRPVIQVPTDGNYRRFEPGPDIYLKIHIRKRLNERG